MNRLITSFAAKTTALVLAMLTLLTALGLAASAAVAFYFAGSAGTVDAARARAAERVLYRYAYAVAENYLYAGDLGAYDDMPFTYTILDESGQTLTTTYKGGDYLAKSTYHYWYTEWTDESHYTEKRLDAVLYADYSMHGEGWLPLIVNAVASWHEYRFLLVVLAGVSFLIFGVLTVFLCRAAGWHSGESTPRCGAMDRIPLDAYTALYVGVAVAQVMLLAEVASSRVAMAVFLSLFSILDVFLLLAYTISIAVRVKTHTLWSNTLVGRLLRFFWRGVGTVWRHLPMLWQAIGVIAVLLFVEFLFLANGELDNVAVFWLCKNLLLVPFVLLLLLGLGRLQKGIRLIATGRVEHQVDTDYLPGALRDAAQDINHIGDGLSEAVEARLRSERFKTELITNVSHDIKTPLTSIINYVDLLQKEQPENERVADYLGVLERQSARLKKLIEDLVEASKASTGSLSVTPSPCELFVLLEQTVGEYTEKATAAGLTILLNCPDTPVTVLADGKHLWRVFDNLMNNVCKYALPDTRVYLDLTARDGAAQVTFRNISRAQLNISGEELMGRFVRGDAARNTEGSGLGLSIARSLTELQGGSLEITVDGDLFKVTVTLPIWVPQP